MPSIETLGNAAEDLRQNSLFDYARGLGLDPSVTNLPGFGLNTVVKDGNLFNPVAASYDWNGQGSPDWWKSQGIGMEGENGSWLVPLAQHNAWETNATQMWNAANSGKLHDLMVKSPVWLGGGLMGAGIGLAGAAGAGGEALSGMDLAADAPSAFSGNGAFSSGGNMFPEIAYDPGTYWPSGSELLGPEQITSEMAFGGGGAGGTPSFDPSVSGLTQPTGGSFDPFDPRSIWRTAKGVKAGMNIFSGLHGLWKSRQLEKTANPLAAVNKDAAARLAALMANPGSVADMPGYKAGIQAVNRGAAASGYLGSGNQATALMDYGEKFYGNEVARLSGLATPPTGATAGAVSAAEIASRALASLGYGVAGLI